ncbi:hypothetical protein ES706_04102 [subsurface metagenome]
MFVNLISLLYISQKMEKKFPHVSKMCNKYIDSGRNMKRWNFFMSEEINHMPKNVIFYTFNH